VTTYQSRRAGAADLAGHARDHLYPALLGKILRCCLSVTLIGGAVLAGPSTIAVTGAWVALPTPVTAGVPRFETGPCAYRLGAGQDDGQSVVCGFVVVAERHAVPEGRTIRLPVAIYKALSPTPAPEMTVLLAGGPGLSDQSFATLLTAYGPAYQGLAAQHDVVIFDQRGTGKAQPALQCPEMGGDLLPLSALLVERSQCRDRLLAAGIDLAAYTTTESAADVNDIRLALGYPAMTIIGGSYGTDLGLAVVRDFGPTVRSLTLASVVPPQQPFFFDFVPGFDRALRSLFADCAADPACNGPYPDLQLAYQSTVARLDQTPAHLAVRDSASGTITSRPINGAAYTLYLSLAFYSTDIIPWMPDMLSRGARGDFTWLQTLFPGLVGSPLDPRASGMQASVVCSKNPTQTQLDTVFASTREALPEVRAGLEQRSRDWLAICDTWPSRGADPRANDPVTSDRPAVLISGQFDPITPPSNAATAKRTLANAVTVTLPGGGHIPLFPGTPPGDCGFAIMLSNIDNPGQPDFTCAATLKTHYAELPLFLAGAPSLAPSSVPTTSPAPGTSVGPTAAPSTSPSAGINDDDTGGGVPGWLVLVALLALGVGLGWWYRRRRAV
jgi:pimeloyl-ACP methyl ester carboxylesterase